MKILSAGKLTICGRPDLDTLKLLEHGSISGGAVFYDKGDRSVSNGRILISY